MINKIQITSPNKVQNVSFRQNNVTTPTKEKQNNEDKKVFTDKQKLAIAGTLVALAGVGIYIATRGKNKKPLEQGQETIQQTKDVLLDAFKKEGNKFSKGKALNADGSMFNGTILTPKGRTLEYKDGVLQQVLDKEGNAVKKYSHDSKGRIQKLTMDKNIIDFVRDDATGKLLSAGESSFYYANDGSLKYMSGYSKEKGSKVFTEFYPNTNRPKTKYATAQGGHYFEFDEKGKQILDISTAQSLHRSRFFSGGNNLVLNDKDGLLGWESYHSYCPGPEGKSGSVLGDKLFLTTPDYQDFKVVIKKFVGENGKHTPKSIHIRGEQNSLLVDDINKGIATLRMEQIQSARYNLKTGEIEMLPDCVCTKEEVKQAIDELVAVAKKIKSKARNLNNYAKEKNGFQEKATQAFNGGLPHVGI